jgi:tetratricopeptide (TPR) repeat protein
MKRFALVAACAALIAAPVAGQFAKADPERRPPTVRFPGMSPIPLPPHGHGLEAVPGADEPAGNDARSPSGQSEKPPSTSDGGKDEAPAPQTRAQLIDDLYARLAASKDADETNGIMTAIDRLELKSGSDAGDLLMARAIAAMGVKSYDVAETLLDKIVELYPDWAEGWNKRATLRFVLDDDKGSMADIAHVLKIEPRHVGALSGMGMILERDGFRDDALRAYRHALAIAPQLESLKDSVDRLTKSVEGQDL